MQNKLTVSTLLIYMYEYVYTVQTIPDPLRNAERGLERSPRYKHTKDKATGRDRREQFMTMVAPPGRSSRFTAFVRDEPMH
jgi:hypothetical protein